MYDYKTSSYIAYLKARDFLDVARNLDIQEDFKLVPTVINAAFSCELFLKAILIWKNESSDPIRYHSLKNLFDMLDKEEQDKIKQNANVYNWDSFIKEADRAFEEWRYIHEKDKCLEISISEVIRFAESLCLFYGTRHLKQEVLNDK